jgi:hypothetical protein
VLGTAVFGRVLSLWMAKSLMNNDPIVHKIVKDDASASKELDTIFVIEGLQVEVLGHIVVDGYSVTRRYEWMDTKGVCPCFARVAFLKHGCTPKTAMTGGQL